MSFQPVFGFLFCLMFSLAACKPDSRDKPGALPKTEAAERKPLRKINRVRLNEKAAALKAYAKNNDYNTHYALLIDFSLFSGAKRLVLYDLQKEKIVSTGLVAHGQGSNYLTEDVPFSNVEGSLCSSKGRYKIGAKYYGRFGWAYKLHGLNPTNNNAYNRFVVLHSHACVPNYENETGICRSDGCPTLNPAYFEEIQRVLDKEKRPVLLEIYK
ncbi:murein L,D-transpeptidase catalytic domain family protein [Chitinophaga sedimenti]|uniref:murein L,D-transpeptidase catalytic domain-containing protein n=1 Tax=Chitinophaga sedimenti TaxID=2033606 RepID=UPI002003798A|nr:murein L,D-transpeptidase catalytic domain family protein [Chitinophaga sedimenti]MCK7558621.1 murein L,D-transpeptidase catalytic domain family protein [Chitinophaga sedimenti]